MTTLALIAHDRMKPDMVAWAQRHAGRLSAFDLVATGTTGSQVLAACPGLRVTLLKSGPLGGDQQVGALIAEQKVSSLFFFIDSMTALPHDVDVKALTRLSTLYNIPMALDVATADLLITHPGFPGL